MRENFEEVKNKIDIRDIANYLLGEPVRGMFRFPGERSASIRVYPESRSFYDFGRGVGGDAIRLWAHVRGIDNWEALSELKAFYGISDTEDRQDIRRRIEQQEKAQDAARRAEREQKKRWRAEVSFWERVSEVCGKITSRCDPLSDGWGFAINQKQLAEYRLDELCLEKGGGMMWKRI